MSTILLASPIPAFAMDTPHWGHWLDNAGAIEEEAARAGHEVAWLAVLQHDGRGYGRFEPLLSRLASLADEHNGLNVSRRGFSLQPPEGDAGWSTPTRLQAICTARNLIIDHALRHRHDWIYFADSDISAPDDVLTRLLELDWPVCGAHVPTYDLDGIGITQLTHNGSLVTFPAQADCRLHWNTAGSLLVSRECFRRVPWRHDPDANYSDDPATQVEMERLGYPTVVRHDVICTHHPQAIGPLEDRGLDLGAYAA